MASALADEPMRKSRTSTPESIETDLADLWRDLARPDSPIARAVMSNLVVVRDHLDVDGGDMDAMLGGLAIDDVVARHPSRLILLEHDAGRLNPAAPFAAAVGIVVFGAGSARYGIEAIAVRAACGEASLPSIVRRYITGDLPTTVWWTADVATRPPLEALVEIGRQLVYDSRGWRDVRAAIQALAPLVAEHRIDLADVNWRRLSPVRDVLADMAGTGTLAALFAGADVRVVHRSDESALGWLLSGWVMAVSGQQAPAALKTEAASSDADDAVLAITIRRDNREVTATLASRRIVIKASDSPAPPLVVGIAAETPGDAIAAELRNLAHDVALRDTIAALVRYFAV